MRQSNFKTIKVSEVKTGWMPSFDKFNPLEYHGPPEVGSQLLINIVDEEGKSCMEWREVVADDYEEVNDATK